MAGEVEEPFRLSFQADSLHSGSISFGRFEAESLCWERRSSFSHNRYLEEVEKYSKPGSVIEKAAILEAHFKKKGFRSHSSSECQSGTENQTSDNETVEDVSYREEIKHTNHGGYLRQYKNMQSMLHQEENEYVNEDLHLKENNNTDNMTWEEEFEHLSGYHHSQELHKSPDCSEYDGECEVSECERDPEFVCMKPKVESITVALVCCTPEYVEPKRVFDHETGGRTACTADVQIETSPITEVPISKVSNVDIKPEDIYHSSDSLITKNVDSPKKEEETYSKVRAASRSNTFRPRVMSYINVTQFQRNKVKEAPNDSMKKNMMQQETLKAEKLTSRSTTLTARSMHRALKKEVSHISNAEVLHDAGSREQEQKTRKTAQPLSSVSGKIASGARRDVNMTRPTVTKPGSKQNAANFTFKCDERAARRKEFNTKLEEKMHARETEMNQIHARTVEKKEADIRQLRKSLNFKATPMPAFYHSAVPGHGRNKDASTKSRNLWGKSLNQGNEASERSPSCSKARSVVLPTRELANKSDLREATEATDCPSVVSCDSTASSPAPAIFPRYTSKVTSNTVTGVKEKKEKSADLRRHGVSDGSKATKGHHIVERKLRGSDRSTYKTAKMAMKSVVKGKGSGMGHLAVGFVAS